MQRKTILTVAAALALSAITGCVMYFASPAEVASDTADKARQNSTAQLPRQDSVIATNSSTQPLLQSPASAAAGNVMHQEMLNLLNRSQSLRAFVYEAQKHPELGGYLYAGYVLEICRNFPYPPDPVQVKADVKSAIAAQIQAQSALAARCDMSVQELKTAQEQMPAFDSRKPYDADPQVALHHNLLVAETPDAKLAAINAILVNGDALELNLLSPFVMIKDKQGADQTAHYFDGQWYVSQGDKNKLYLAQDLAMCNLGLDCGTNSTRGLVLCANRGYCGDTAIDAIRNGLATQSANSFDDVMTLANRLSAAFSKKNAHAFMIPDHK
ncbi:hypothetical protein [Undibacterium sp. TJN19]|uniref:hypothetical protein n=1 Tax=Undibacterium sp. TJN19 TaxID=3413055 RepID=UPI003BEFA9EE